MAREIRPWAEFTLVRDQGSASLDFPYGGRTNQDELSVIPLWLEILLEVKTGETGPAHF
jgi:hypothetical protein